MELEISVISRGDTNLRHNTTIGIHFSTAGWNAETGAGHRISIRGTEFVLFISVLIQESSTRLYNCCYSYLLQVTSLEFLHLDVKGVWWDFHSWKFSIYLVESRNGVHQGDRK
ncbi:hypothetical protein R1flu_013474 [Riccia fluitans]|uniref:Uncharacterized protein n=1 Tax=Riccia fluitans TaxID=41844 RepID=A0ABD1YDE5_9MARC